MNTVEITCRPPHAILRLPPDTIAALDRFSAALPTDGTPWQIDVAIGRTPADTIHLTATPATDPEDQAA